MNKFTGWFLVAIDWVFDSITNSPTFQWVAGKYNSARDWAISFHERAMFHTQRTADKAAVVRDNSKVFANKTVAVTAKVTGHYYWKDAPAYVRIPIYILFANVAALVTLPTIGEFKGSVNNHELALETPKGGSMIIETIARSMDRELKTDGWCPSGSLTELSNIRYDICGFQEGVHQIMSRAMQEVQNHFTREGPASPSDSDIDAALNELNRSNQWSLFFDANDTKTQFKFAVGHLDAYNKRVVSGDNGTRTYPRINNLGTMLQALASVSGSEVIRLKEKAATDDTFGLSTRVDFFRALEAQAAMCWMMKAVNADFASVIDKQSASDVFQQAAESACTGIGTIPYMVMNGRGYGLTPSDLRVLYGDMSNAVNDLGYAQSALAGGALSHPRP